MTFRNYGWDTRLNGRKSKYNYDGIVRIEFNIKVLQLVINTDCKKLNNATCEN